MSFTGNLGNAARFSVLSSGSINNVGSTTILNGDVGAVTAISNTGTIQTLSGTILPLNDPAVVSGINDASTAYTLGTGQTSTPINAVLESNTMPFTPGVYAATNATLGNTQTITLDAGGNSNALFSFIITGSLNMGAASNVALINGASSCNVFWFASGNTTIGFSLASIFAGNVLSQGGITTGFGTVVDGRLIQLNSESPMDLNTNTIGSPCACFVKGTQIKTINGYRSIESLKVGDEIITLGSIVNNNMINDNKTMGKKIKWIGKNSLINPTRDMYPVCIKKNAISPNVPSTDLCLSLLHLVTINDKTTCVGNLINGDTINKNILSSVEYYHIELDGHYMIDANGVPAETLIGDDNKHKFMAI